MKNNANHYESLDTSEDDDLKLDEIDDMQR